MTRYPSFHGVPFKITAALQGIAFFSNSGASKTLFKDVACSSVAFLEISGVSKLKPMDTLRQAFFGLGSYKQMKVICHEAVVEKGESVFDLCSGKKS